MPIKSVNFFYSFAFSSYAPKFENIILLIYWKKKVDEKKTLAKKKKTLPLLTHPSFLGYKNRIALALIVGLN